MYPLHYFILSLSLRIRIGSIYWPNITSVAPSNFIYQKKMSLGAAQLQSSRAKADQTVDSTFPLRNRWLTCSLMASFL